MKNSKWVGLLAYVSAITFAHTIGLPSAAHSSHRYIILGTMMRGTEPNAEV